MSLRNSKCVGGLMGALDSHGPTIAMFGSLLGIAASMYFAYKKAKVTAQIQEKYEEKKEAIENDEEKSEDEKKHELTSLRVSTALEIVIENKWAVGSAVGAGGCAILCNYLNGAIITGLTTLAIASKDELKKVYEKAKETMDSETFQEFKNKILNDDVEKALNKEKPKAVDDDVPWYTDASFAKNAFYDTELKAIVWITEDALQKAIDETSKKTFVKWNDWWNGGLGKDKTNFGYVMGWGPKNKFKAHIGTTMHNGITVKTIEYDVKPVLLGVE